MKVLFLKQSLSLAFLCNELAATCVLIPKDLSHPSFVTGVIVHSHWAFELVKSKFYFHSSTNFQKYCIIELSQKLF